MANKRMAECHPDRPYRARGLCNACYTGQWIRAHRNDSDREYLSPEKRYEYWKRWQSKYPGRSHRRDAGINQEIAETMLAEQGGMCAICGRADGKWQVDHDHKTHAIRGVLCNLCNAGLGSFRDDMEILGKAIAYLQRDWSDAPKATRQHRKYERPKRRVVVSWSTEL
jgi:hypothetical protein